MREVFEVPISPFCDGRSKAGSQKVESNQNAQNTLISPASPKTLMTCHI
jgi:hypothetical protein